MATTYNADEIRTLLSPAQLLARLGYQPQMTGPDEQVYRSMFDPARKPVLFVNLRLGIWFDRSLSKTSRPCSGDVLDLGNALFLPDSGDELLKKLSAIIDHRSAGHRRPRKATLLPCYRISEVKPLGFNPEITSYLQKEGLWQLAVGHLQEVYYYLIDEQKRRKDFFGAGWANENGGWEICAKNYTGHIGNQGMSFLQGDPDRLVIFLNFQDYLVWRYKHQADVFSILVLNSTTFLDAAVKRSQHFNQIAFYGVPYETDTSVKELIVKTGAERLLLNA